MTAFIDLRSANLARQQEWDSDNRTTLAFRGNELAGEVGEACNIIKKIERERLGLPGSRATRLQLAEELADVVICADLIAMDEGIDLFGEAVPAKFNATSEKIGLSTRLNPGSGPSAHPSVHITRADAALPFLVAIGRDAIAIRAGTVIEVNGRTHAFESDHPIPMANLVPGQDYGIGIDADGKIFVDRMTGNPLIGDWLGGFHYAPGGNATARTGGDDIPAINPCSIWDVEFRPACPDPRGMAIVDLEGEHRVWIDIYMLGVDHKTDGTSRHGVTIADGKSLDVLDYETASRIYAAHGKRLITYDEFRVVAYGVTEKSAAARDPERTGLDAARTSRCGLMQATGNLWIWGIDTDPDELRPSLFGGSWISGSDAGSRFAYLDYCWPEYSYEGFGARGACDHLAPV